MDREIDITFFVLDWEDVCKAVKDFVLAAEKTTDTEDNHWSFEWDSSEGQLHIVAKLARESVVSPTDQ